MEKYRVLAWDDQVIDWIAEIMEEVPKLRPDWSVIYENPDGYSEQLKNFRQDYRDRMSSYRPEKGPAEISVVFDLYHSGQVTSIDSDGYVFAILDERYGTQDKVFDRHYGSKTIVPVLREGKRDINIVIATQHAGDCDPGTILTGGKGQIVSFLEKEEISKSAALRRAVANMIVAAVYRRQECEKLTRDNEILRRGLRGEKPMVGKSPAFLNVVETAEQVAQKNVTVLICGESGTGKEVIARKIHDASPRQDGPFVPVNLGALPPTLVESELFGYVPGAFTGADQKGRQGIFESANGGTLFLDEITAMPLEQQARLLRVLQERKIRPVGVSGDKPVDVRIIAATNENLAEKVNSGEFRTDLYYRLRVIQLEMPLLRNRKKDIPLLIDHFLEQYTVIHDTGSKKLSQEAIELLNNYPWPGNVRELKNAIEGAVVLCQGEEILPEHLKLDSTIVIAPPSPPPDKPVHPCKITGLEIDGETADGAVKAIWEASRSEPTEKICAPELPADEYGWAVMLAWFAAFHKTGKDAKNNKAAWEEVFQPYSNRSSIARRMIKRIRGESDLNDLTGVPSQNQIHRNTADGFMQFCRTTGIDWPFK